MSENSRYNFYTFSLFKTFLTWSIVVWTSSSFAQVVTVIRKDSKAGIEAVSIFVEKKGVLTDSLGRASLEIFGPGDSLSFRHIAFQPLLYSWEEIQKQGFQITMEAQALDLNEVSISFNRWAQRRSEVPQHIARITDSQIKLQQPQTAADMLGVTGEVFIQKSQQGGGSPMIRGFAANRVLLVIDGVRMNNAIYRSGNLHNVISLDPFTTDHTEIVFGPGSVGFGSDALGGVMDFHTLRHRLGKGKELTLTQGKALGRFSTANQEKTGHLDFNLATDRWSWIFSASYNDFEDLKMGRRGRPEYLRNEYVGTLDQQDIRIPNEKPLIQRFSGYHQWNLLQKLQLKASENWQLDYAFHYSETSNIPRYDRLIEKNNGLPREAEWFYGPQKWQMHSLQAQNKKPTVLFDEWQITTAFQQLEESRNDRDFQSPILRTRREKVAVVSINVDAKKSLTKGFQLFYGGEFLGNKVNSLAHSRDIFEGTILPISTRYPNGSTWQSIAAYVNGIYKHNEWWNFTGGMRYNHIFLYAPFDRTFISFPFDAVNNDIGALNGSLGAIFLPHDAWQFQVNLASGFRAPNIDDMGKIFDSEPGNVIVPNPRLQAEYAYSIDMGLQHKWGENSSLSLNTFYTWLDNAIVRRDFLFEGRDSIFFDGTLSKVQSDVNAESAQLYGVQLKLQMDLQPWLQLTSAYTWMEGQDQEDLPLRHISPNYGATHFIFKKEDLLVDLYGIYNGEIEASRLAPSERNKVHIYAIDQEGMPFSPRWYTLNVKTSYTFSQDFTLHLGLENITDQRYRPYSSGIVAAGRNWVFSLEKRL